MATDPRAALQDLVAALHAHLDAAVRTQDPDADAVLDAAAAVAEAFDSYDEALYEASGVDTPLDLVDDEDDDDEIDDEDEDDLDDDSEDDDELEDLEDVADLEDPAR